jgi:hypothetical protein
MVGAVGCDSLVVVTALKVLNHISKSCAIFNGRCFKSFDYALFSTFSISLWHLGIKLILLNCSELCLCSFIIANIVVWEMSLQIE